MSALLKSSATLRIVTINDVYELRNLPKLQTFLSRLTSPSPSAVLLAGDFLSPSTLSSIDSGKGAVAALRAAGITHACLGNHEADLKLPVLRQRIAEFSPVTVINTNMRAEHPPEASWLHGNHGGDDDDDDDDDNSRCLTPPYSIITTPCQRVKVALLGLMSDEENMFRDGTFKGVPISNVLTTFSSFYQQLVPSKADFVIPMTHQFVTRDRDLAKHMLDDLQFDKGIIIGGHEHDIIHETIVREEKNGRNETTAADNDGGDGIQIIKTGSDVHHASLVDVTFDVSTTPATVTNIDTTIVDLTQFEDSQLVKTIVEKYMSVIAMLENEIIIDASMVPDNTDLSSEGTRKRQTTIGGFFCEAIKQELEVDACVINGATIKGGTSYANNRISYSQLKSELPFPTKMVVVPMTRNELLEAIEFSRTHSEGVPIEDDGDVEKKGFLQMNFGLEMSDELYTGDGRDELRVALPRNLLTGFCKIQPLMDVGKRLQEEDNFPVDDDYVPALDLVTRYACKAKWQLISRTGELTFQDLDLNNDGVLDKDEVKAMVKKTLGYEPTDFAVEDMLKAIDADGNGTVDAGEFSYFLATMQRHKEW